MRTRESTTTMGCESHGYLHLAGSLTSWSLTVFSFSCASYAWESENGLDVTVRKAATLLPFWSPRGV